MNTFFKEVDPESDLGRKIDQLLASIFEQFPVSDHEVVVGEVFARMESQLLVDQSVRVLFQELWPKIEDLIKTDRESARVLLKDAIRKHFPISDLAW